MVDLSKHKSSAMLYYKGEPCERCGNSQRYKADRQCVNCRVQKNKRDSQLRAMRQAKLDAAEAGISPDHRRMIERLRDTQEQRLDGYDV
jgi:hypothetical protein